MISSSRLHQLTEYLAMPLHLAGSLSVTPFSPHKASLVFEGDTRVYTVCHVPHMSPSLLELCTPIKGTNARVALRGNQAAGATTPSPSPRKMCRKESDHKGIILPSFVCLLES